MNGFKTNVTLELPYDKRQVEFEATVESVGNDGIGAYEYWGARCFDHGQDYIEEFSIGRVWDGESGVEIVGLEREEIVTQVYEDVNLTDEVCKQMEQAYGDKLEDL